MRRNHKFFVGDSCYEIGGDQILRASKGDPTIHDRDLAMVAQIQSCSLAIEEPNGQHFLHIDSQRGKFGYQDGQGGTIAQGVTPRLAARPSAAITGAVAASSTKM
jgi:hypothetical protein